MPLYSLLRLPLFRLNQPLSIAFSSLLQLLQLWSHCSLFSRKVRSVQRKGHFFAEAEGQVEGVTHVGTPLSPSPGQALTSTSLLRHSQSGFSGALSQLISLRAEISACWATADRREGGPGSSTELSCSQLGPRPAGAADPSLSLPAASSILAPFTGLLSGRAVLTSTYTYYNFSI